MNLHQCSICPVIERALDLFRTSAPEWIGDAGPPVVYRIKDDLIGGVLLSFDLLGIPATFSGGCENLMFQQSRAP